METFDELFCMNFLVWDGIDLIPTKQYKEIFHKESLKCIKSTQAYIIFQSKLKKVKHSRPLEILYIVNKKTNEVKYTTKKLEQIIL